MYTDIEIRMLEEKLDTLQLDKVMKISKHGKNLASVSVNEISKTMFTTVVAHITLDDGRDFYITENGNIATEDEVLELEDSSPKPDDRGMIEIPLFGIYRRIRTQIRK